MDKSIGSASGPSSPFRIGIMQGRLSPPLGDNAQYFPEDRWREEFSLASDCGFDTIEWLYDLETKDGNPILDPAGLTEIEALSDANAVTVASVCADYFKDHSLANPDDRERRIIEARLVRLIEAASVLGVKTIVVPFLEGSSVRTEAEREIATHGLECGLTLAAKTKVNIVLETDLPAETLRGWLEQIDHPSIGVNYDLGNAVANGFDPVEEISLLGTMIRGVHIKDRTPGGPNVPLGTGAVDFRSALQTLWKTGYRGHLVLETVRGQDYLTDAAANLAYLQDIMTSLDFDE